MKKVRLWCDRPSTGLINLRNALVESGVDCKRIKINSTRYRPKGIILYLIGGIVQHRAGLMDIVYLC